MSPRPSLADKDIFKMCRAFGHKWDDFAPLKRRADSWATMFERCERCGAECSFSMEADGTRWGVSYVYPDGYKETGYHGERRLSRGEVRKDVVRRIQGKAKVEAPKRHLRAAS